MENRYKGVVHNYTYIQYIHIPHHFMFVERGVNEMLFLHLKEGDSYLERVSPVTKDLLEELQADLKKS